MKTYIILFILITFNCCQAQSEIKQTSSPVDLFAIKINPLSIITATTNLQFELRTGLHQSFQLGMYFNHTGDFLVSEKYTGLGITPEYRFYLAGLKQPLNGWYVSPFLRYVHFDIKNDVNDHSNYSSVGAGLTFGWEHVSRSGFLINLFAGPGYNYKFNEKSTGGHDFTFMPGYYLGFIRFGMQLGLSFRNDYLYAIPNKY